MYPDKRHMIAEAKLRWMLGFAALAALLFLLLAFAVWQGTEFGFDIPIEKAIQSWRSPALDTFMVAVGLPGTPPQALVLNALVVLIIFACRMIPEGITLLVFIPTFGTISSFFRYAIDRARPGADLFHIFDPDKDRGQSFPSGHSGNFIIICGFLIYVGLSLLPPSWHRHVLLFLYALYMVLMPVSRMYVADHWPSDILGGVLLGSAFLVLMILFYERIRIRLNNTGIRSLLRLLGEVTVARKS